MYRFIFICLGFTMLIAVFLNNERYRGGTWNNSSPFDIMFLLWVKRSKFAESPPLLHQRILQQLEKIIIGWCKVRWIWRVEYNRPTDFQKMFPFFCSCRMRAYVFMEGYYVFPIDGRFSAILIWTRCNCWMHKCAFNVLLY